MKFIGLLLLGVLPMFPLVGQNPSPNLDSKIKTMLELFEKNQANLKAELADVKNSNSALINANLNLFKDLKEIQDRLLFLEAENAHLRSALARTRRPINLNTASLDELTRLPTVDTAMADKIISNRPYNSIEDVTLNAHFDPAKLKEIAALITVE